MHKIRIHLLAAAMLEAGALRAQPVAGTVRPRAVPQPDRIRLAVNGTLVSDRAAVVLGEGDELAFLPPVSGG